MPLTRPQVSPAPQEGCVYAGADPGSNPVFPPPEAFCNPPFRLPSTSLSHAPLAVYCSGV